MRTTAILLAAVTLLGGAAWAVTTGSPVFIRSRDTRVLEAPNSTARAIATLQPGVQVTYVGREEKTPYHKVKLTDGREGSVYYSNISPTRPKEEVVMRNDKPERLDAHAAAGAGAAARGLTAGARAYGQSGEVSDATFKRLELVESFGEKLTDAKVDPAHLPRVLAEHRQRAGLGDEAEGGAR